MWIGYCGPSGYGQISWNGRPAKSHRISYSLAYGEPPNGLAVCHSCDTPRCVNPKHLWLGTHLDNVADRVQKAEHEQDTN